MSEIPKNNNRDINEKLDYFLAGAAATSYKLPLIVDEIKEYEGKILIDTKNIKSKYLVFDKDTFLEKIKTLKEKQ